MQAFLAAALVFALPCAAIAQVASLQIKVFEGEGSVHPAGARVSHPLTVEVTDDSGHPVAGAAVSFQMPADGPGGLFANGLRTDLSLTGADGRATLHAMQLNRTAGQFNIRITAVKEQARAGIVSLQYIGEKGAVPVAAAQEKSAASPAVTPTTAKVAATAPPMQAVATHSPGVTPTTTKMGPGIGKKWIIIGVLAAGAGAAAAVLSHSHGSSSGSTSSSSTVGIGTPTVVIGSPNP